MKTSPLDLFFASPENAFFWPHERLHEAVRETVARSHLPAVSTIVEPTGPEGAEPDGRALGRWIRHAARGMGLEGTPQEISSVALEGALVAKGAYLVIAHLGGDLGSVGVGLVRGAFGGCVVVRPDGTDWHVSSHALADAIRKASTRSTAVSNLFEGLNGGEAALRRLVETSGLGAAKLTVVRYDLDAAHPLAEQLKQTGFVRGVAAYASVTGLQSVAEVMAAFTLGNAAFTGVIDIGRIAGWGMLATSSALLQYLATVLRGRMSLSVAATLKKRLLEGTLLISDKEVRKQGFGSLLARLNEASVVEQTNPADLFGVAVPLARFVAAYVLFAEGAMPGVLCTILTLFLVATALVISDYARKYRACYRTRLDLTEDLVDKIIGHRTRAVQGNARRLHDVEDLDLHAYATKSVGLNVNTAVSAVFARVWLFVAGGGLLLAFALGTKSAALLPSAVAVFLVYGALGPALGAASQWVTWVAAWEGVRPLFLAGGSRPRATRAAEGESGTGLDTVVSSLSFAYRDAARPVLNNANLRIRSGERILLGGPSGGGKTTLSKLLTGELRATSGTVLVDGIDHYAVSEAEWRRRVASSPQFHENYLFTNTFGFNVDPKTIDGSLSQEAFEVCNELGLGELIAKMPSGTAQILGETGWQLSHGERSRVFIARSLLQGADLLLFDESFGALDPESLARALLCVRKRAKTLVVIAHQ